MVYSQVWLSLLSCFPAPLPVLLQLCFFLLLQKRNPRVTKTYSPSHYPYHCSVSSDGIWMYVLFLTVRRTFGVLLFQSVEAASQLRSLSFVCPFLYLSGMLSSILHGLGKTGIAFACSIVSLAIRLFCVLYLIPMIGFRGYFYGILCSQICLDFLLILALHHNIIYN